MTPNQDRAAPNYLHADSQYIKLGIIVMNVAAMLSNSEMYTRKLVKQNQDQEQKNLVQNIIVSAENLSLKQRFANEEVTQSNVNSSWDEIVEEWYNSDPDVWTIL